MGRLAPLLALISATLAALAACESVDPCYEVAGAFALTRPTGASELVPGESVRFEWEPIDVPGAVVAFVLVDDDVRIPVGTVETGVGVHDVQTADSGQPVPMGVYRIQGVFGGCALSAPPYDGGATRLVFAQGVTFADASLTITGAQTPRDLELTTVALSTVELELLADPTPGADGDELLFATGAVPGELVAMTRRYAFTGMTTTGAAIPGGTYRVVARVRARDGAVVYDVPGPQLTWSP
ncbi:MAG: hypothetical protein K8M05_32265 [Deltaproteobacteria bacterium]|nr:hypothetical protein [Kofleriaceae bacterium]